MTVLCLSLFYTNSTISSSSPTWFAQFARILSSGFPVPNPWDAPLLLPVPQNVQFLTLNFSNDLFYTSHFLFYAIIKFIQISIYPVLNYLFLIKGIVSCDIFDFKFYHLTTSSGRIRGTGTLKWFGFLCWILAVIFEFETLPGGMHIPGSWFAAQGSHFDVYPKLLRTIIIKTV